MLCWIVFSEACRRYSFPSPHFSLYPNTMSILQRTPTTFHHGEEASSAGIFVDFFVLEIDRINKLWRAKQSQDCIVLNRYIRIVISFGFGRHIGNCAVWSSCVNFWMMCHPMVTSYRCLTIAANVPNRTGMLPDTWNASLSCSINNFNPAWYVLIRVKWKEGSDYKHLMMQFHSTSSLELLFLLPS